MADWHEIARGFDYDRWANHQWLDFLVSKALGDPDMAIFGHILAAQSTWFERCNGVSPTSMPVVEPNSESIDSLHDKWVALLKDRTDDVEISYRRTTGEALTLPLSDIA